MRLYFLMFITTVCFLFLLKMAKKQKYLRFSKITFSVNLILIGSIQSCISKIDISQFINTHGVFHEVLLPLPCVRNPQPDFQFEISLIDSTSQTMCEFRNSFSFP